jgi:DNA-binding NarL/FixJ family response regulator
MATIPAKVLLVDDHEMVRKGLSLLVSEQPDMQVVGDARNGLEALELTRSKVPDIILIDVHLGGDDGIQVATTMREICPTARLLALSGDPDPALVERALRAGISGYLTKDSGPTELIRALRSVLSGHTYLTPEIAGSLVQGFLRRPPPAPSTTHPLLSSREQELLRLIALGKRSKEIASLLEVGVKTVETYRSRLMRKLSCGSSVELARYAIREGIAPL